MTRSISFPAACDHGTQGRKALFAPSRLRDVAVRVARVMPFLAATVRALALITCVPDLVRLLPRQLGYEG